MKKKYLNLVMLKGYVGADPKIYRSENSQSIICNFSLATSRFIIKKGIDEIYKNTSQNKKSLEYFDKKTTWHDIVCFNEQANIANKLAVKGAYLFITGEIINNDYINEAGQKIYRKNKIKCHNIFAVPSFDTNDTNVSSSHVSSPNRSSHDEDFIEENYIGDDSINDNSVDDLPF
jgi:single stranded DNA-binding protein